MCKNAHLDGYSNSDPQKIYFPKGSLVVTCKGSETQIAQQGGVIPSYAVSCHVLTPSQVSIVLPKRHNALLYIEDTASFCVNVLPANMIHESSYSHEQENGQLETATYKDQTFQQCTFIPSPRLKIAAVALECVVKHTIELEHYTIVYGAVIKTHTNTMLKPIMQEQVKEYFSKQEA